MTEGSYTFNRQFTTIIVVTAVAVMLYLLAPVLPPFLIAMAMAYIANPAVTYFEKVRGIPRTITILAGSLLLSGIFVVVGLLLWPTLKDQFSRYSTLLPVYVESAHKAARSALSLPELDLSNKESLQPSENSESAVERQSGADDPDADNASSTKQGELIDMARQSIPQAGDVAAKTATLVKDSTAALLRILSSLFLIPVVGFYLLRDWNRLTKSVFKIVPRSYRKRTIRIAKTADKVLGGFLRGQGLVMLALAAMYSSGLLLIGLDFALLIGICAGLLSFVPFLGTITGLVMAILSVVVQSLGWLEFGLVLLVFSIGQFIEGNFLTPKLVGDEIDFHPVAVIFAVATGAQLLGVVGVLIALPVGAVLWAVAKEIVLEQSTD
jgi:predicted PurR-regulated permease PerM